MNIYIVDDSKNDARLVEMMLLGYSPELTVTIELDSVKAEKTIQDPSAKIDLIVLDLNMPVVDGIQILNTMITKNVNIPVIVCSNYIDQYDEGINREKVLKVLDKNNIPNINPDSVADIFIELNTKKSCMVLSGELKNYLSNKKERAHAFCDHLNQLKKSLMEG